MKKSLVLTAIVFALSAGALVHFDFVEVPYINAAQVVQSDNEENTSLSHKPTTRGKETSSDVTTIGKLSAMPNPNVYRRGNGDLFLKLNEQFHVKAKLSNDNKSWLGDGSAEQLDLNEQVEVVQ